MFGCYSNKRLTEQERKILMAEPDDAIWYSLLVKGLFNDCRCFQIREDIDIPQRQEDDGVVLMVEDGSIIYFKTLNHSFDSEDFDALQEVCTFLDDKFHRPINVYMACTSDVKYNYGDVGSKINVKLVLSKFYSDDACKIIERLESKLINHEKFTYKDSVDHIFLPFSHYNGMEVFYKKYDKYMDLFNSYDV